MIVITGAGGFIGANLLERLNQENYKDIILVDDFSVEAKNQNLEGATYTEKIDRSEFFQWLDQNHKMVQFIFHLGAKSATTGFDKSVYKSLNFEYSQEVWNRCVRYGLPLVYASSAATYGDGSLGYDDDHNLIDSLEPLNDYGYYKNEFDKWALAQKEQPYFWAGLKFFNVYGSKEYHKGRMSSVVYHAFNQINATDKMKLFKSHKEGIEDGEQKRDFIYVKDLSDVMLFLLNHRKDSGIYNLGTGNARTFKDLVIATFKAMGKPIDIEYIDTPLDIRDKYQYFTEANMNKLRAIGYSKEFTSLEEGVTDYVHILMER